MQRIIIEVNPQLNQKTNEIAQNSKDIKTASEQLSQTLSQFYEIIKQIRLQIHPIDTLTIPDNHTGIFEIHTSNTKYPAISQLCEQVGYEIKIIQAIDI